MPWPRRGPSRRSTRGERYVAGSESSGDLLEGPERPPPISALGPLIEPSLSQLLDCEPANPAKWSEQSVPTLQSGRLAPACLYALGKHPVLARDIPEKSRLPGLQQHGEGQDAQR